MKMMGMLPSRRYNQSDGLDDNATSSASLPSAEASTGYGSFSVSDDDMQLMLTISCALWWFVVVSCAVSLPFYGYAFRALWRLRHHWHHWQYIILGIILADTIMLCLMFSSLLIAKYFHSLRIGPLLCKSMVFTTNVVAFFTNWCWVFIFGRRFLAIYQPLRRFRPKGSSRKKLTYLLFALTITAVVVQAWSILFTTEYNVDGMVYCELDQNLTSYATIKWVVLAETGLSYLLPLVLIVLADVLVLYRSYSGDLFTTITSEQLGSGSGLGTGDTVGIPGHLLTAKIISERRMKERMKRKYRSIMQCVMAASLDMLLNLPDYSLQIIDNFVPFREHPDYFRFYYGLEAFAYVLFFLQYPMIAVYVRWLLKDFESQSARSNKRKEASLSDVLLTHSMPSKSVTEKNKRELSPQYPPYQLECRDWQRGRSKSTEYSSSLLQDTTGVSLSTISPFLAH